MVGCGVVHAVSEWRIRTGASEASSGGEDEEVVEEDAGAEVAADALDVVTFIREGGRAAVHAARTPRSLIVVNVRVLVVVNV